MVNCVAQGVHLNDKQLQLRKIIEENLHILKSEIEVFPEEKMSYEERMKVYKKMAGAAHELHLSLDPKPKHHRYMISNRDLLPEDPEFYDHIHPVEDLLDYLDDIHANDDPEDQTIGAKFTFKVYSRRWGHKDNYTLTRTEMGWDTDFMSSGGKGDKSANPGLFNALNHDSVNYPEALPGYLEWLWEQAKEQGLSQEEVQNALNDLAEWISICESNSPQGIFEVYK